MTKHVIEVNDLNYATEISQSEGLVLLDFTAQWCGPCKMVAPLVEKIARDRAGAVKVAKIDIDEAPATSTDLGIRGAPTFVVLRDGKEVRRKTGAMAESALLALLEGA